MRENFEDNEVIRADMWDVSVNNSENNYVEHYKLGKLKEGRYYFFHWPMRKNYFVFHFSEATQRESIIGKD